MDALAGWHREVIGQALRGTLRLDGEDEDDFGPLAPALQGVAPRWAQEHGIQQTYLQLQRWFGNMPARVDKARRQSGLIVSPLRPDLQFNNPDRRGRPTYVEVDTDPQRMAGHVAARAAGVRSVFLLVDSNSGALLRKHIIPVRGRSVTRVARPGRPLTLTRRDVFDA